MKNIAPPPVPLWKPLVLAAVMLAATIVILAFNVYVGGALFIMGVFL